MVVLEVPWLMRDWTSSASARSSSNSLKIGAICLVLSDQDKSFEKMRNFNCGGRETHPLPAASASFQAEETVAFCFCRTANSQPAATLAESWREPLAHVNGALWLSSHCSSSMSAAVCNEMPAYLRGATFRWSWAGRLFGRFLRPVDGHGAKHVGVVSGGDETGFLHHGFNAVRGVKSPGSAG